MQVVVGESRDFAVLVKILEMEGRDDGGGKAGEWSEGIGTPPRFKKVGSNHEDFYRLRRPWSGGVKRFDGLSCGRWMMKGEEAGGPPKLFRTR